jgi:hypothetical protein
MLHYAIKLDTAGAISKMPKRRRAAERQALDNLLRALNSKQYVCTDELELRARLDFITHRTPAKDGLAKGSYAVRDGAKVRVLESESAVRNNPNSFVFVTSGGLVGGELVGTWRRIALPGLGVMICEYAELDKAYNELMTRQTPYTATIW